MTPVMSTSTVFAGIGPGIESAARADILRGKPRTPGGPPLPLRSELMALKEPEPAGRAVTVFVHRNHAFELCAGLAHPFLWFAGYRGTFTYGDYDDSLAFARVGDASVHLLALDYERYAVAADPAGWCAWFGHRLRHLRDCCDAPIVVANWPSTEGHAALVNDRLAAWCRELPATCVWDWAALSRQLGAPFTDARAAGFKGTALGEHACVLLARDLGLLRIPALLRPRIKAVVVDLDDTLYAGVLGEDGVAGVTADAAHLEIQRELVQLSASGVFLAVVSRNEASDVDELFASRIDFPLRREHCSAIVAEWGTKADAVARVAAHLRIAAGDMLIVDDNAGEIAHVAAAHPGIAVLHARSPEHTLFWLRHFPSLHGYGPGAEDSLRVADLRADEERRRRQASAADPARYLASLQLEVVLSWNPVDRRARLVELSSKTNQFNTGLRRFTAVDVARRLTTPSAATIAIAMRDVLADSGTIGAVFTRLEGDALVVDEICISCRALGRGIEDAVITMALGEAVRRLGARRVVFAFRRGPRNAPARAWLSTFVGGAGVEDGARVAVEWAALASVHLQREWPIHVRWEAPATAAPAPGRA